MGTQITKFLIRLDYNCFSDNKDVYIKTKTIQWFEHIKTTKPDDSHRVEKLKQTASQLGQLEQNAFYKFNASLKNLLDSQIRDTKELEESTRLLNELHACILKIKPPRKGFLQSYMSMFKLMFSAKGSAWELWLESYPIYKEKINALTQQLEQKKQKLSQEISRLNDDKQSVNQHIKVLEQSYDMICQFEKTCTQSLNSDTELTKAQQQILTQDLIPIKIQRINEIQQQLLIARQTEMTLDLFINQNKSQIKGIEQAIYSTTSAMEITTSLYIIQESEATINHTKVQHKSTAESFNPQKLNAARAMVDKALKQLEQSNLK